jgi:voltage-gated potassium channel Kch
MPPTSVPLWARIRYALDNALARGVSTVAAWLGLLSLAIVVVAGIVLQVAGIEVEDGKRAGFVEGVWLSLQRTLDAGTGGGDEGWAFRAVSLTVTLGGLFVVTAFIGLMANGIDRKLEQLRRGRSLVVEQSHTLVLGWSTKLPTILSELSIANDNQASAAIVVLADMDKQEMDHAVRRWVPKGSTTRVVCRTGRPYNVAELAVVRPESARAVIVLGSDDDPGGAYTLKTVLALLSANVPESAPLVVEVHDSRRASALRTATGGRVLPVVSSEIIARITAQVCRQSGLSAVYQELLDFDGDEIYFGSDDRLAGTTFGDALLAYGRSSVIGIRSAEGEVRLVPDMDTVLRKGDQVVAISRDDDTVVFDTDPAIGDVPSVDPSARPPRAEHVLVLGWNEMGPHLLSELDAYAVDGASVTVVCDPALGGEPGGAARSLLDVRVTHGDTTDEELLGRLVADRWPDHVVVLCYHALPVAEADARTLLSLLELRHLFAQGSGQPAPTVVAELLDVDDVALAPVTAADDFVVSEKLTSYVLAQLSENPELAQVFEELLAAGGCEIAIRHAADYVPAGVVTYRQLVARFRRLGDVVVGYRERAADGRAGPVVVNPPKDSRVVVTALTEVVALNQPAEAPAAPPVRKRRRPSRPAA